jgi:hypothetical protein
MSTLEPIQRVRIADSNGEYCLYGREGLREARRLMRAALATDRDLVRRGFFWHVLIDDAAGTGIRIEWTRRLAERTE